MNDIEFSHMPEVGVSYGVEKDESGTAWLSVAFTNEEAGDTHNKKRARQIISGRVAVARRGGVRKVRAISSSTSKTALQIVKCMRATFKPNGLVNESKFVRAIPLDDEGNVVHAKIVRTPIDDCPPGMSIWEQLVSEFEKATKA